MPETLDRYLSYSIGVHIVGSDVWGYWGKDDTPPTWKRVCDNIYARIYDFNSYDGKKCHLMIGTCQITYYDTENEPHFLLSKLYSWFSFYGNEENINLQIERYKILD